MSQVNTDISQTLNIKTRRRDTFSLEIEVLDENGDDFNFTTHTADMDVMDEPDGTVLFALSSGSGITLTDGQISLLRAAASMDHPEGEYVYDLQITYPDASVKTWFKGTFTINNDVTA